MRKLQKEVLENHSRYLERKAIYRKTGYDIDLEHALIIEEASPISGKILEAGTGKGYFALALAQEGFCFTTFDISEAEQNFARLNLGYYGLEHQVGFHTADAENLPYKDGYYDAVFSVKMIHHLSSAVGVCEEMIRVLAPSGKLIISDFNTHGLSIIDKIHSLENRRHQVCGATLNDVVQILSERGFKTRRLYSDCQDTIVACRRKPGEG
ncbi:MAG: class I SAM-dependent methyltransferase [Syntrophobacteraceae bacterium]